jgi:hypothetical protein
MSHYGTTHVPLRGDEGIPLDDTPNIVLSFVTDRRMPL